MYGGNKGILFSRGFSLLMVTGGWLVVLHIISESKLPVAVDGNLIFFFFLGCEIPSFWVTKNCLGTDASTLDRKKETRLHTAREEVREECFVKFPPPPPPFFSTDSHLLCQLLEINPSISRITAHLLRLLNGTDA